MNILSLFTRKHDPTYSSPAVYYTFAFSLPPDTDIHVLAERLLKHNLARVAVSSAEGEPRFGQQYERSRKLRKFAESITELESVVKGDVPIWRWAWRNPGAVVPGFRHGILKFRRGPRHAEPDKGILDAINGIKESVSALDESMVDRGLIAGAFSRVDEKTFMPGYLAGDPFIRLELDTLTIDSAQLKVGEIVAMLVLHRSGTALLNLIAIPGDRLTTDELLEASASSAVSMSRTVLPRFLGSNVEVDPARVAEDKWVKNDSGELERDITWIGDGMPLQELFRSYSLLVDAVAGGKRGLGDWMCYTTLFVDGFHCCNSRRQWLSKHSSDLAGVLRRDLGYATTKPEVVKAALANEHGRSQDDSRFFESGNALLVTWAFKDRIERSDPVSHHFTIAIVENLLLQYWQLRSLDYRLSNLELKMGPLTQAQNELVTGLEEYRNTKLMSGEARMIQRQMSDGLELDRSYERVLDQLNTVQQLITTKTAYIQERRTIIVTAAGVLAAAMLGVSAVKDILLVAGGVNTGRFPGTLAAPLTWFAGRGPDGIWALYLIVVGLVLLSVVLVFVRIDVKKRRRPKRLRGVPWRLSYTLSDPTYVRGKPADKESGTANREL